MDLLYGWDWGLDTQRDQDLVRSMANSPPVIGYPDTHYNVFNEKMNYAHRPVGGRPIAYRLVVDSSLSGVTQSCRVPNKIMLPKISDVAACAPLALGSEEWVAASIDVELQALRDRERPRWRFMADLCKEQAEHGRRFFMENPHACSDRDCGNRTS